MADPRSPRLPPRARLTLATVVAAAVTVGVALLLLGDLPLPVRRLVSGMAIATTSLAVAGACALRARHARGRRRRAWWLIAGACGCAAAGNAWFLLTGTAIGPRSVPSVADVLLLAALVLGAAGLASYPRTPRRPTELLRMVLDGALLGGSICFVASVTVFPAVLGPAGDLDLARAVPLGVPVLDLVAATVALLLLLRSGRAEALPLGLAGAGFLCFAVSDFALAVLSARGPFSFGGPTDLGWVVGWLLIGIAVWASPHSVSGRLDVGREVSSIPGTAVMFVVFSVAAAFSFGAAMGGGLGEVAGALWLVVLCGAVGRQVLLIADNELLRRSLERRVVERTREVRDVTARSDQLIDAVGDGIYGLDARGRVTFVNPAGARTLGVAAADLVGRDAHAGFHASPPEPGAHSEDFCYVRTAVQHGSTTTSVDDRYVRADGQTLPVEATATPLVSDGQVLGAVVVFRDVTQRREVERLKDEFVSMVSHELRTPLTSIQGALGMLDAGTLGEMTPAGRRMTRIALDSSLRLSRLINDILDMERIGSGLIAMQVAEHDVADLVEAAVRQLRVLADRAGVRVVLGALDGRVTADADRVDQTLVNLIGNAVKFSPPGSTIEIDTAVRGSFVEVSVADHGRGIPADRLEAVFERFEQVDSSDAREKGGTGLGLAISRSIVERHGGRIWAEPNPEGGSVFRFTLPRSAAVEARHTA